MIRLHLLGYKGFIALSQLDKQFLGKITTVVIAKDKGIKEDYFEETAAWCKAHNLLWFERTKEPPIKNETAIAIGWRWLISDAAKLVVFHDSLLPKYRGFNPLVTALINGDTAIGVTSLYGSNEYDRGDIISQKKINITYPIKINDAIEKIAGLYASLLNDFFSGAVDAIPQNESEATYSLWRDATDYFIDWHLSAAEIVRFIDAVGFPYDGAKTKFDDKIVIVDNATEVPDVPVANRTAGKVIFKEGNCFTIVCGSGLISISEFKDEDGNSIDLSGKFRLRFQ
ncbi:MAG: formyltransferase family protein [Bacteroidota bacterium]